MGLAEACEFLGAMASRRFFPRSGTAHVLYSSQRILQLDDVRVLFDPHGSKIESVDLHRWTVSTSPPIISRVVGCQALTFFTSAA